ncbi:MAG: aromatic ring-hydroxylating dioxygenase subunit alpha [Actinomycetota bacterium]|nr:aromatic ring-hydroxylating dioxygenase subunit alpha [Actinomycetota bacterium]
MPPTVLTENVRHILDQLDDELPDLQKARTMPSDVYTSEEFFRFELESVFFREWLCLGHQSEVPNPGDYYTINIGPEPLIVVRTQEGTINVLSSICQHRGYPVTSQAPSGNAKSFRCPYHWWNYGHDGALIAAPEMQRSCDFSELKAETALPSLKVEMWNGFIFANMDPDAAPLAPALAKLDAEMKAFGTEDMVATERLYYPDQPWNWKGMHENALEPYHTSYVHKGYHEVAPASLAEFVEWDDDDGQIMHPTYFRHPDAGFNPTNQAMFPILEHLDDVRRSRVMFASVLPTVFFALMPDQVFVFLILPQSANEITLRINWLFPESSFKHPRFDWAYEAQTGANDLINQQDMVTNALMQEGQRSRFVKRGRYSHQEATLPQFNRWLTKRYLAHARNLAG